MKKLLSFFFLLSAPLFGQVAFDLSFQQVNSGGTAYNEVLVNPAASQLVGANGSRVISARPVTISDVSGNNTFISGIDANTDLTLRGGLAGATIALGRAATGGITLTAAGTNQNIALTPSGTGIVQVPVGGIRWGSFTGLSAVASGQLALDYIGGTTPALLLQESGVDKAYFATSAGNATISTVGSLTLQSTGTNQNITLTPSGTGVVTTSKVYAITGTTVGSASTRWLGTDGGSGWVLNSPTGGDIGLDINNVPALLVKGSSSNIILGTTTDSSNGRLQLATHTTSAGGIGFGDTPLYRAQTGALALSDPSGGNPQFRFYEGATIKGAIQTSSGTMLIQTLTAASMLLKTNDTTALTLDSSQNQFQAGTTTVYHGSATGAANSVTKLIKAVTGIADNTATAVLTVTIPNAAHSASLRVRLAGSLGAGGAIGANEATGTVSYDFAIARTAGVNAVTTISTAYGSGMANVAGAATITVTAAASAISGAVGAVNTFTVNVTIDSGSGSSANHTCQVEAEVLNANATGITIS